MSLFTDEIRVGRTLVGGRYRVLRRLGAGGMATVFLAEDTRLGRDVAIKRLHTDAPKASLRRFKQEARLGAALNHPNLVAIYDTVAADEGALIVMEYVEGTPLSELAGGSRMPPGRALPILRAVASALDHAHAEGVIHRDVKPGNVIVAADGTAKLADLGIARAVGASQITSEGSVVGTLPYMSPERLAGPGAGGPESDIYALAAVAFELLSGGPPSEASSTGEAAARGPLDLRREWPDGPAVAVSVLERALDDDPGRRQPSAGRMVEELDAALGKGGAPAAATSGVTEATVRLDPRGDTEVRAAGAGRGAIGSLPGASGRDRSRSRRPLAIALLALAVLAIGGIALSSIGGEESGGGEQASAGDKPAQQQEQQEPEPEPAPAPAEEQPGAASGGGESGSALNDTGFALINEGRYEEAIPVLQRAVDAFGEGSTDLTYAYALYNLGHAMRLAGRPEEAIPVLEQRLEFPNQRGIVQRELDAARAAAGLEGDGSSGDGSGDDDD